jgi:D-arabinose 1-dehydrogenase-like Zn-dependent alcohol dehydrogenase
MALEEKRALVSSGPHQTGGWKIKNIHLRPLKENELLVEMVASGVCQTDLHFGGMESGSGVHYPRILGHEGKATIDR